MIKSIETTWSNFIVLYYFNPPPTHLVRLTQHRYSNGNYSISLRNSKETSRRKKKFKYRCRSDLSLTTFERLIRRFGLLTRIWYFLPWRKQSKYFRMELSPPRYVSDQNVSGSSTCYFKRPVYKRVSSYVWPSQAVQNTNACTWTVQSDYDVTADCRSKFVLYAKSMA